MCKPINIIQLDKEKCNACYTCIRACPVKAIHVSKDSVFPYIEERTCISCGICTKDTCAYGAISYIDSKEEVKKLLNSDGKVAAICAPSIAGEFDDITDYRKFVKMIRLLGFSYVTEMSFGVDIIARKYKELTHDHFQGKYYITGNCPPIVSLIEKHYPELTGNLVPYVSPVAASAIVARKEYGESLKIVHITPCIGAKKDLSRYQGPAKIDGILTFKELRELFEEFNIQETFSEYSDFDDPLGYKGSIYPLSQGFIEATDMELGILKEHTITVDGKETSIAAVKQFLELDKTIRHNLNLFFCEGCIMGPGTSDKGRKILRYALVKDYIKRRLTDFDKDKWEKNLEKHIDHKEYNITFENKKYELPVPDKQAWKSILKRIKERNNNKEVNCGACGFHTCKGLTIAITQNIAVIEMCVTFSQFSNREESLTFKRTEEELNMAKQELKTTKETLDEVREMLFSRNKALSILIKNLKKGIVFVDENLKVVESNLGFVEIMGEEVEMIHEVIPYIVGADLKTLLPPTLVSQFTYLLTHDETTIKRDVEIEGKLINVSIFQLIPGKLVGAIFRNLHSDEERPDEIIHRVTEAIEENLRQVQQIGFILGEGAAKTEKMLRSIIKTYNK